MITPPYLKPGDTIGLISPAGITNKTEQENAIRNIIDAGFHIREGKHTYSRHGFFAGTDAERASDITELLTNNKIKAILISRGGYGCLRTLQNMNVSLFKNYPKWMIGFSDITVFHNFLSSINIESIHGPMGKTIKQKDSPNFVQLLKILKGEPISYRGNSQAGSHEGESTGILTGGNLATLNSLRGSPYDINLKGKILLLEDINESIYQIDRMMLNLHYCKGFDQIKGVIVGQMTNIKDTTPPFEMTIHELIKTHFSHLNIPVLMGFPAGHEENNMPLVMGREIKLIIENNEYQIMMKAE